MSIIVVPIVMNCGPTSLASHIEQEIISLKLLLSFIIFLSNRLCRNGLST